ncbi:MAG: rhomboid family intramembrane serine protease [Proteobacteria bacterium]|nr:rhomboid family intramembrane serine protease [Pseudomonadota bacterium]
MDAQRRIPWVMIALAVANVGVFAWELAQGASAMQPTAQWMADHGGNFGPLTLDGEQWRLFTSMFLHYGVLHIAMNMIGLVDGGRHVERMYGPAGFLTLYLVSGLVGSLASALRGNAVSAGASGAIFGVFGAFGAYLVVHRARLDAEEVKKQARGLVVFLAYNVFFGVTAKGIDLVAHLGGLGAGFVVGLALELGTTPGHSTLRRSLVVLVLGTAMVFGATKLVTPKPDPMVELGVLEEKLLGRWNATVREVQAGKLDDDHVAAVLEEILPPWREARAKLAREGDGEVHQLVLDYMAARQEGWEIILVGMRAHDEAEVKRGNDRFQQGDAVIAKLKALKE